ncbi:hypothetical protein PN497_16150 [Sphaerospermopsis kisseleviana CS-549]|uniref:PIN domain-containing protein n=1 Tax=Sphaerospermopsis kisseleviana CS-549 TaxID=3021783 RepID=A0ABT4ZTW8_9CYAN|nr:hypothetical protein [Sphaerospermopsis kisseleviana]MDB9442880.1 hypothetical protein [Sphaerospermopsis kisseleviana CS-549]BAZ79762.1 hypothetical protein NIES73_10080 [Sphaerospermopsis kisseleviana NIES-73]
METTRKTIDQVLRRFPLLKESEDIFPNWLNLVTTNKVMGKRTHDVRIVAVMLAYQVTHILTFNPSDFLLTTSIVNEYLIAELKMKASAFTSNHNKEDIDVLICWEDDAKIKDSLPSKVVVLRDVLEKAIEAKEIEL